MSLPEEVGTIVILAQIAVFMGTGFLAALLERSIRGIALAVFALAYGISLFLAQFTAATWLRGYPSLFLLCFMVVLLFTGLKDRVLRDIPDE